MNLRLYVAHSVVARRLWEPGQRVAVAVSGGLDSVVLLDLLVRTVGVHGGILSVVPPAVILRFEMLRWLL